MEVNEGLFAFGTEEEGAVGGVVHEEVFGAEAVSQRSAALQWMAALAYNCG